jgi:hypothetical protein
MSETAAERLPCKLCGGPVEWGQLCNTCKSIEPYPVTGIANVDTCMCQECDALFAPYKQGRSMITKMCWPCLSAKKKQTWNKNKAIREGRVNPTNTEKTLPFVEKIEESKQDPGWHVNPVIMSPPLPKLDVVASLKKRLPDRVIVLDFKQFPWALAWVKDHYETEHPEEHLVREIAEKVVPDWLKEYLLNDYQEQAPLPPWEELIDAE